MIAALKYKVMQEVAATLTHNVDHNIVYKSVSVNSSMTERISAEGNLLAQNIASTIMISGTERISFERSRTQVTSRSVLRGKTQPHRLIRKVRVVSNFGEIWSTGIL